MKNKQSKKQPSAWKKLALTSEELEGMPKERLEVHLSEQVTSEMPWILAWIGRHWKKLLIILIVIMVSGVIIGLVVWSAVAP